MYPVQPLWRIQRMRGSAEYGLDMQKSVPVKLLKIECAFLPKRSDCVLSFCASSSTVIGVPCSQSVSNSLRSQPILTTAIWSSYQEWETAARSWFIFLPSGRSSQLILGDSQWRIEAHEARRGLSCGLLHQQLLRGSWSGLWDGPCWQGEINADKDKI